ncbi:MAG: hypothetical protein ABF876_05325 [Acetobacter aceti]
MFWLFALSVLNIAISWWNCYAVGSCWDDGRRAGGWMRLVLWSGATQSAIGFTMAYFLAIMSVLAIAHHFPHALLRYSTDILILGVTIPALGSGLILAIYSIREAIRDRSLLSFTTAGWNTFALIDNTASLGNACSKAWSDLFSHEGHEDNDLTAAVAVMAIALTCISAGLGILTTALLIDGYRLPCRMPRAAVSAQ